MKKTDGRIRRAQELRKERRTQILQAAREVFAEKGYHGASIQNIIDQAAIARGTFYLHFDSKKAAFGEILDEYLAQMDEAITRVDLAVETSAYQQLLDNLKRVLFLVEQNRDLSRLLLRQSTDLDHEFDQKIHEFYHSVTSMIMGSLETGVELGLVHKGNLQLQAAFVLGSIKEILLQVILENTLDEPLSASALAQEILFFALNGLLLSENLSLDVAQILP